MSLTFIKKAGPAAAQPKQQDPTPAAPQPKTQTAKPSSTPSWMKVGKKAQQAMAQADAAAEKAKQEAGKMFRFWMPPDEERTVTFLSGELDAEGMLDIPMFHEHRIKINGEWQNFVCTEEQEPCPICAAGDARSTLVGVLSVIDHSEYTIKSGPNAGKTIKNSRKLFVPPRSVVKVLNKHAMKRGGLIGCTFEVSRTGDREPGCGNQFEFVEKLSLAELGQKCGLKPEELAPANYEEEIVYRSADELVKLGLGKAVKGVGHEKGVSTKGLANEL